MKTAFISLQQKPVAFLGMLPYLNTNNLFKFDMRRSVFNDFGSKFACVDPTGEQPLTGMIVSVEKVSFGGFSVFVSYFLVG